MESESSDNSSKSQRSHSHQAQSCQSASTNDELRQASLCPLQRNHGSTSSDKKLSNGPTRNVLGGEKNWLEHNPNQNSSFTGTGSAYNQHCMDVDANTMDIVD
jgi:hypothetical protein